ncbi:MULTISPECIES: alpha-hydroxy acid oxidase [Paeniglutamicibacter]|uniref:Isopentenyl diphosphate isomerase/L-lactate dehydrogenase-like FMN-dependent dehydrogenase n=1 Tax=Paeniglutamicibacter sulfureus TaxID=43666 RepID=A0ABU2BGT0_9MICC|nr:MULTISPECIES: alpha-hydroxy acid oxidase [Paeniglutamicibacter]MCV9993215.1 alpha-hydroxy-acid oxidizing protein [Paeniglutamicibacter sp. ZC-3]MDO2933441.1 alpha-hydroxy acid oxidase [Paeniglutamicibacter sulfureus]MDR7357848.1 isopentenyl diphosphate isomerase/L-lactate dehydrogenase-like FMN-dependent dehydrogenase [Paeniglutamicibacter sulfureus]
MKRSLTRIPAALAQLKFKSLPKPGKGPASGALNLEDLRRLAKRRTPTAAFDYADGGSYAEEALERNYRAYRNTELLPGILRDVSAVDPSVTVAGGRFSLPVGIAPTGLTRLMHAAGERAGAAAAARQNIPFTLSTMGTVSIEETAAAAPGGTRWFQLYLGQDRAASLAMMRRAREAGYSALLLTVDTAVTSNRFRDQRNGMTLPPTLGPSTVLDALRRPGWCLDFLTTEPLGFANFPDNTGNVSAQFNTMFDASLNYTDLAWVREAWPGTLIVKGVQGPEDAVACFGHGVDGVVVSNHGGRQLDRAPVPVLQLPAIRAAVGPDRLIIADSGIMSGGDVVATLAAGANFTLIGRAYLYGLMAGGQAGVERALEILEREIRQTMALLGVRTLSELGPQHVRLGEG